jgi:L-threonylcarbamoyladenylate synthase
MRSRRIHFSAAGNRAYESWQVECVRHLRDGGIALLPTETGYMLAVHALDTTALELLYTTKGRAWNRATHVAVSTVMAADRILDLAPRLREMLIHFSPGPLTVVGNPFPEMPSLLLAEDGSLGVRIPEHRGTLAILEALKGPVTATSANLDGEPHHLRAEAILGQFPGEKTQNWFVLEDDERRYSTPSTIVKMGTEGVDILREGSVSREELMSS